MAQSNDILLISFWSPYNFCFIKYGDFFKLDVYNFRIILSLSVELNLLLLFLKLLYPQ